MKPEFTDAVDALNLATTYRHLNSKITEWDVGENPTGVPEPTESVINNKLIELITEYNANQYQRDRQYPSIGDQLDMQYHDQIDGTTTWKDAVAKVKADHPKPE